MASDTKERTAKERVLWAVGLAAVIFYALIPVAWIVSLSLKPSSQLTDGKFFPAQRRSRTTEPSSRTPSFPRRCATRSASR